MLRHIKVGDILRNRAGDLAIIAEIDHDLQYTVLYRTPNGDQHIVTMEGKYYDPGTIESPYDIIDPTIYNTDSAATESSTFVEPVNFIKDKVIYNLGHIITLPNGTQLYQSNTGHIQFIPQPGASIWQPSNWINLQE